MESIVIGVESDETRSPNFSGETNIKQLKTQKDKDTIVTIIHIIFFTQSLFFFT